MLQVEEAERQSKAVILMNPALKDIPSAAGVMGVRYAPSSSLPAELVPFLAVP